MNTGGNVYLSDIQPRLLKLIFHIEANGLMVASLDNPSRELDKWSEAHLLTLRRYFPCYRISPLLPSSELHAEAGVGEADIPASGVYFRDVFFNDLWIITQWRMFFLIAVPVSEGFLFRIPVVRSITVSVEFSDFTSLLTTNPSYSSP